MVNAPTGPAKIPARFDAMHREHAGGPVQRKKQACFGLGHLVTKIVIAPLISPIESRTSRRKSKPQPTGNENKELAANLRESLDTKVIQHHGIRDAYHYIGSVRSHLYANKIDSRAGAVAVTREEEP